MVYTLEALSHLIDHTNLRPDATEHDLEKLCKEAITHRFGMVAINQVQSKYCSKLLSGTDVHTGAAIAFPLGQTSIAAKAFEARDAIENGADEIDYVINLTKTKQHDWSYIEEEMRTIVEICNDASAISKAIFETCYLTDDEKIYLCSIAKNVKPTFIKTSTGFGPQGATINDVSLMKEYVGQEVQVKAAGGIRDAATFLAMIRAGATRIGTSAGIQIMEELKQSVFTAGLNMLEI